jgi:hypothetical protein
MAQPEPSQLPESFKVAEAQLLCAMKQGAILLQRLIHINDPVQKTLQRRRERIGMSENWVTVFRDPKKYAFHHLFIAFWLKGTFTRLSSSIWW